MRTRRRLVARGLARASLTALAVLALSAEGCDTGSDAGSHAASESSGGAVRVVMQSLFFSPPDVKANVGQRVVWRNEDSSPHNVTYVSGPRFKSSAARMHLGDRFSIRLTKPGTIHYFCSLHPWMKATIEVSS